MMEFTGMYRSGWSYKDAFQARILQITMKKEGLLTLLGEAALSSGPLVGETEGAVIRVQWDPERDVRLDRLSYRSLQLGISGEMVRRWIDEWIVKIEDVTEPVRRWKGLIDEKGEEGLNQVASEVSEKWPEEVFDLEEQLEIRLGMRLTTQPDSIIESST